VAIAIPAPPPPARRSALPAPRRWDGRAGERLVEQQHAGVLNQRPGDTALSRPSSSRRLSSEAPRLKTTAAPKAPSGAANPSPSAKTSPGNAAVPTAWEKNASPRKTIQVPEQAGWHGENQDLDQATLYERQLERLEQGSD
jgi:hypothetical protein